MSTQLQMNNGSYWHTPLTVDEVIGLAQRGPWIRLPLVGDASHYEPLNVVLACEHVTAIRPMPDGSA